MLHGGYCDVLAREVLTGSVEMFSSLLQEEADSILRAARNDAAAEIGKAKSAAEAEGAKKIAAAKARLWSLAAPQATRGWSTPNWSES